MLHLHPFSEVMFAPLRWWCILTLLVTIVCTSSVMTLLHPFSDNMFAPIRYIFTSLVIICFHLFFHDTLAPFWAQDIHTSSDMESSHLFVQRMFAPLVTTCSHHLGDNLFAPLRWRLICTSSVTTRLHPSMITCSHLFGDVLFAPL